MSDCRFGVSPVNYPDPDPDQTGRMPRLSRVFAGCTATLLILSCRGSSNINNDRVQNFIHRPIYLDYRITLSLIQRESMNEEYTQSRIHLTKVLIGRLEYSKLLPNCVSVRSKTCCILAKYIRNALSKYQSDQCIHWVSITTKTNVPSFDEVAFRRNNEQEELLILFCVIIKLGKIEFINVKGGFVIS